MSIYIFLLLAIAAIATSIVVPYLAIRAWMAMRASEEYSTKASLWLIYCGGGISILVSGRSLNSAVLMESLSNSSSGLSSLIERLLQLLALYLGMFAASKLLRSNIAFVASRSTMLVGAFCLLSIAAPFLGGVFGTDPRLLPAFFLMPIVFLTAATNLHWEMDDLLESVKPPLVALLGLSCILLVLSPSLVLEPYSIGHIPKFPFRLWGLTLHANALGPLGFLLLLIEISAKSSTTVRRLTVISIALTCFVLAQSKTAWLAGLAALFFLWLYNLVTSKQIEPISKALRICLAGIALIGVAFIYLNNTSEILNATSDRTLGGGNLSGRPIIWAVAMEEWKRNPLFGYGPYIWSPDFRQRIGMNFAFHAHNQFFQVIGESGLVGLLSLTTYVLVLAFAAYSGLTRARPFLATYLAFIALRSISEPTFRTLSAFGGDAMLHLPLFLGAYIELSRNLKLPSVAGRNHA